MARFFSGRQRAEHDSLVGHQCEWEVEKYQRCEERIGLQADHVEPYGKGGETEEDNFLWLCPAHHLIKHLIDGDTWIMKYFKGKK